MINTFQLIWGVTIFFLGMCTYTWGFTKMIKSSKYTPWVRLFFITAALVINVGLGWAILILFEAHAGI